MKKVILLTLLFTFMISSSVHSVSWAYVFVVWEGNVYEVKQDESIADSEIGEVIGKVKTIPNDRTGSYFGNASNYYSKGTKYYKMNGISTADAIAIKDGNQWVKAVYVHEAPFHILNLFSNIFIIMAMIIMALTIVGVVLHNKKQSIPK